MNDEAEKPEKYCKFSPLKRQAYLELIHKGGRLMASAKQIGITYRTIQNYMKEHPEFKDEIDQAEIISCEPIEDKLRELALGGSFSAIVYYLQNRAQSRWRDTRTAPVLISNYNREDKPVHDLTNDLKAMLKNIKKPQKKEEEDGNE